MKIKKLMKCKTVCISAVDNVPRKYLRTKMEALMDPNLIWSTKRNPIFSFPFPLKISIKEIYTNLHF